MTDGVNKHFVKRCLFINWIPSVQYKRPAKLPLVSFWFRFSFSWVSVLSYVSSEFCQFPFVVISIVVGILFIVNKIKRTQRVNLHYVIRLIWCQDQGSTGVEERRHQQVSLFLHLCQCVGWLVRTCTPHFVCDSPITVAMMMDRDRWKG